MRVRYLGIEIPSEGTPAMDTLLAERALQYNRFLVEGRTVELEQGASEKDPQGRLLRYVYVDGEMVNKALLVSGYAVVADFPPDLRERPAFAVAEESARRDQRGVWEPPRPPDGQGTPTATPTPVQSFPGGTLPVPPGALGRNTKCDYSGSAIPVIKGNVDPRTQERIYHVPGGLFYSTTEVSESDGDRWFCTEEEALAAGWERSKR